MYAFLSVLVVCASSLTALILVLLYKQRSQTHAPLAELQQRIGALEDRATAVAMGRHR